MMQATEKRGHNQDSGQQLVNPNRVWRIMMAPPRPECGDERVSPVHADYDQRY
jgi:hypothetical protein